MNGRWRQRKRTVWRKEKRRPVIGSATLLFDDHEMKCGLVDLTADGARLTSKIASEIPANFRLGIGRMPSNCHEACLIWRRGTEFGVRFQSAASAGSGILVGFGLP